MFNHSSRCQMIWGTLCFRGWGGGWVHIIYKTSKQFNVCEKAKLQYLLLRKKRWLCVTAHHLIGGCWEVTEGGPCQGALIPVSVKHSFKQKFGNQINQKQMCEDFKIFGFWNMEGNLVVLLVKKKTHNTLTPTNVVLSLWWWSIKTHTNSATKQLPTKHGGFWY